MSSTRRGIAWTFTDTLEDLDCAVLHAHRYQDIKEKTKELAKTGTQTGANINAGKIKHMKIDTRSEYKNLRTWEARSLLREIERRDSELHVRNRASSA